METVVFQQRIFTVKGIVEILRQGFTSLVNRYVRIRQKKR
jgi:hypothetical protein